MKVTDFQVVHFTEIVEGSARQVLILYALGEDGHLYEFAGGKWLRIPVKDAKDFEPRRTEMISKAIVSP